MTDLRSPSGVMMVRTAHTRPLLTVAATCTGPHSVRTTGPVTSAASAQELVAGVLG